MNRTILGASLFVSLLAGLVLFSKVSQEGNPNSEVAEEAPKSQFQAKALKKIVGYYTSWSMYRTPKFTPNDIDGSLITHLNYAFVKTDKDGNLILIDPWADTDHRTDWNAERTYWGNFGQLSTLKEKYPGLKTLFSVGGWTLSDAFSTLAANPKSRVNFANNCVQFCDKYGFDGIDIDWEYPGFADHGGRPEDRQNFTLLLAELSSAAKAHKPPLLVTFAAPSAEPHLKNLEIEQISHFLDWINIMTYDFHGAWGGPNDRVTNHNAPLDPAKEGSPDLCVTRAVNYYLSKGFPAEKIVLGMPLYGRSYAGVDSTPDGLYSTYSGPGTGTTSELGIRFYSDIKKNLLSKYEKFWDKQANVPYLYNKQAKEFISYDNEESLALKCKLVNDLGLGGGMVWELGFDVIPGWEAMRLLNREIK